MYKVNPTLLDLAIVYHNMTYAEIDQALTNLKETKFEFEFLRLGAEDKDLTASEKSVIYAINKQLYFVDRNIKTLEEALMVHETKMYEKRTLFGHFEIIYLN